MASLSVQSAISEARRNARYAVSVIERDTGCRAYLVHEGEFPLRGNVEQHVYYYAVYWLDWVSQTPLGAQTLSENRVIVLIVSVIGNGTTVSAQARLGIMDYYDVFTAPPPPNSERLVDFVTAVTGSVLVSATDFRLPSVRDWFIAKAKEALKKCSDAVVDIYSSTDYDGFLRAFIDFIADECEKHLGRRVELTYRAHYTVGFGLDNDTLEARHLSATQEFPAPTAEFAPPTARLSLQAHIVTNDSEQRAICIVDVNVELEARGSYKVDVRVSLPHGADVSAPIQISEITRINIPNTSGLRANLDDIIETLKRSHHFTTVFGNFVRDMRAAKQHQRAIVSAMLRDAGHFTSRILRQAVKRVLTQLFNLVYTLANSERGYCDVGASITASTYPQYNFYEIGVFAELSPQAARRNILVYKVPMRIMLHWYKTGAPRITVTSVIEGHAARLAGSSSSIEFTIDCSAAPDLQEVLSIVRTILERLLNDQIAVLTARLLKFFKAHYYDNLREGKVKVGV